jgi:hypothetical protein
MHLPCAHNSRAISLSMAEPTTWKKSSTGSASHRPFSVNLRGSSTPPKLALEAAPSVADAPALPPAAIASHVPIPHQQGGDEQSAADLRF